MKKRCEWLTKRAHADFYVDRRIVQLCRSVTTRRNKFFFVLYKYMPPCCELKNSLLLFYSVKRFQLKQYINNYRNLFMSFIISIERVSSNFAFDAVR